MRMWETGEPLLRTAALNEVADTLTGLADGQLSLRQRAHAVGSGSLLVRTDAGLFGFIHASVAEWLVAAEIGRQLVGGTARPAPLSARPLSQLTADFLCDLAGSQACRAWASRILADPAASEVARANALKVSTRLRTPSQTDLRGALLRGEDLSYRELAGVDLTGADLTDAVLVGANLTGAILRDATLAGRPAGRGTAARRGSARRQPDPRPAGARRPAWRVRGRQQVGPGCTRRRDGGRRRWPAPRAARGRQDSRAAASRWSSRRP